MVTDSNSNDLATANMIFQAQHANASRKLFYSRIPNKNKKSI
jgi:hypothetical protein